MHFEFKCWLTRTPCDGVETCLKLWPIHREIADLDFQKGDCFNSNTHKEASKTVLDSAFVWHPGSSKDQPWALCVGGWSLLLSPSLSPARLLPLSLVSFWLLSCFHIFAPNINQPEAVISMGKEDSGSGKTGALVFILCVRSQRRTSVETVKSPGTVPVLSLCFRTQQHKDDCGRQRVGYLGSFLYAKHRPVT